MDTSRFWLNYRHAANVYRFVEYPSVMAFPLNSLFVCFVLVDSMYQIVRSLGIPDSNIILMVSDGMACEAQNPDPGAVYNDGGQSSKVSHGHCLLCMSLFACLNLVW